jgi:hypothetical protein
MEETVKYFAMLAALAAVFSISAAAQGTYSYSPVTSGNNGQSGIMFDVTAQTGLEITRFGVHGSTTGTSNVDVWYRAGGFSTSSAGWVLAGTASVNFHTANVTIEVPVPLSILMAPNETYGFAIVRHSGSIRYLNSLSTNYSNGDMTVVADGYGGSYSSTTTPTMSTSFFPRSFVGTIWYEKGLSVITPSPLPQGSEQQAYSTTIQADHGQLPYNWNTSFTGLPPNLTASQVGDDLVISGTPTAGSAGTYNFTVTVTDANSDVATKPFSLYILPPAIPAPYADDFSTNQGWQLGTGWQIGSATPFNSSTSGHEEPAFDNSPTSDNMILGHMIGADYTNNMSPVYATSPPIDCTGMTNVQLRFYRWLGVMVGDTVKVQVTNNGSTWTDLFQNGGTVATPTQWQLVAYDMTAVAAGNSAVQFRFQMGGTDASIVSVGWCIDDIEVLDPGPALVVEEGGVGGTVITDNEPVGGLRDMGIVMTGQNVPVDFGFTNNGSSPINISSGAPASYTKSGANPDKFVVNPGPTFPIPVGGSTTMTVTFNSNAGGTTGGPGVYTCTIEVYHDATGPGVGTTPFEIHLRAEAVDPIPDLEVHLTSSTGPLIAHNESPTGTPRDFGDQDINAGPTNPITITLVNAGTGSMTLGTPDMGGTNWTQFLVNVPGNWPGTLAPGADASFEVQFDPSTVGPKDAVVRIYHSDSAKPYPYLVPVAGNGTNSALPGFGANDGAGAIAHNDAPAGPRDFGNVQVGTVSNPITITINNNGGADLTLGTPTLGGTHPGEFNLNLAGFASPVTAGNSTSFEVTFEPTSQGQKDATISITHNDGSVTSPFIINVTGNGVTTAPTASVHIGSAAGTQLTNPAPATGALDFGQQDITAGPTAAVTIYVENTGTSALTLNAPTLGGTDPGEFAIQNAGGFAGTLNPGDPGVTFEIVFDPTTVGTKNATVSFTHNDTATGSPFIINVTGEGILNAPVVEVREGSVTGPVVNSGDPAAPGGGRDLGSIDVSAGATTPVTIVLRNTGTLDLNLGTPALAGANANQFILNTAGMNFQVAPGGDTSFEVSFDPNLGGIKDAQVEFTHDDPTNPSPFVVRIRGTAVDPTGVQITTSSLPSGVAGAAYGPVQMQATQGGTPYDWSLYAGSLPAGVTLSPTGQLSGTPSGFGGAFNVTIRVQETGGGTHERAYTILISGNLTGGGGGGGGGGCTSSQTGTGLALLAMLALAATATRRRRA